MIIHITATPKLNALLPGLIIFPDLLVPPVVKSINKSMTLNNQLLAGSALAIELVVVRLQVLLDVL